MRKSRIEPVVLADAAAAIGTADEWGRRRRSEGGAAAYPLRDDPFLPADRGPSSVQSSQIRLVVPANVDEEESAAELALVRDADLRQLGLASLVVLVQVQQKRDLALAVLGDLLVESRRIRIDEVEMLDDLLPDIVVQHR